MFGIRYVTEKDKEFWMSAGGHVSEREFAAKVFGRSGYIIFDGESPIGIMYYALLWDNMPFLNLLYIEPAYQKQGYGKRAMEAWEQEMRESGYKMVMVSTQVNENAQFFYRKSGYRDCGCLVLNDCPMEQPMEMFLYKIITVQP